MWTYDYSWKDYFIKNCPRININFFINDVVQNNYYWDYLLKEKVLRNNNNDDVN